jgi:hypothetical protein
MIVFLDTNRQKYGTIQPRWTAEDFTSFQID